MYKFCEIYINHISGSLINYNCEKSLIFLKSYIKILNFLWWYINDRTRKIKSIVDCGSNRGFQKSKKKRVGTCRKSMIVTFWTVSVYPITWKLYRTTSWIINEDRTLQWIYGRIWGKAFDLSVFVFAMIEKKQTLGGRRK